MTSLYNCRELLATCAFALPCVRLLISQFSTRLETTIPRGASSFPELLRIIITFISCLTLDQIISFHQYHSRYWTFDIYLIFLFHDIINIFHDCFTLLESLFKPMQQHGWILSNVIDSLNDKFIEGTYINSFSNRTLRETFHLIYVLELPLEYNKYNRPIELCRF